MAPVLHGGQGQGEGWCLRFGYHDHQVNHDYDLAYVLHNRPGVLHGDLVVRPILPLFAIAIGDCLLAVWPRQTCPHASGRPLLPPCQVKRIVGRVKVEPVRLCVAAHGHSEWVTATGVVMVRCRKRHMCVALYAALCTASYAARVYSATYSAVYAVNSTARVRRCKGIHSRPLDDP